MRILQPGPEEQYSYQKRKKVIYHGRRFMVVIKRVMSWFKLVSMEKKMEILLYWCGLTSALSSLNFYFIAEVILMHD